MLTQPNTCPLARLDCAYLNIITFVVYILTKILGVRHGDVKQPAFLLEFIGSVVFTLRDSRRGLVERLIGTPSRAHRIIASGRGPAQPRGKSASTC